MSSETDSLERGGSADPWLTQYDLVDPGKAYDDITYSIKNGENVTLAARVPAGIGKSRLEPLLLKLKLKFYLMGSAE